MNLDVKETEKKIKVKKAKGKVGKKLISASLAVFCIAAPLFANPKKAEAYDYKTHKFLASQGLLTLKQDKGSNALGYFYEDNGAQTIMDYSNMPDFDENDGGLAAIGGFKGHYYDPSTGTNYMGERTNTANNRFCGHYNNAVKNYKEGNKKEAWKELGRALHYLGDLNAPHHAANLPNIGPKGVNLSHADYEAWVDRNYLNYTVNSAPKEAYDNALNSSPWQIGHNSAVNAKKSSYLVGSLYYELDNNNKRTAANNTLPYAQKVTAEVLNKFLKDVGKI